MSGLGREEASWLPRQNVVGARRADRRGDDPIMRRVTAWLVGPAVLSAVWWTMTSPHFSAPEFRAAFLAFAIAGPVLIGLAWWHRRPQSRMGPLLVVFGFAAWPLCLQGSHVPLLFTIGVLAEAPFAFAIFYVCIAFPTGRLSSGFEFGVMATWALTLAVGWIPFLTMLPILQSGGPLAECLPSCPLNALQVLQPSAPFLLSITQIGTAVTVVLAALIAGQQVVRFALSSAPLRRARLPVAIVTIVFMAAFAGYHLARGLSLLDASTMSMVSAIYLAASVALPLGFLAALLRADLFAGQAARRLALQLGSVGTPGSLRVSLATALGDPSLRLGLWDPGRARFVQPDGTDLPTAPAVAGEVWVPVMHGGSRVAGIVTDESLATETRLLESAVSAALVAIRDEQVAEATLALRAEVVSTTDSERRRIARDMHDSAQQRLVALRVKVALAAERLQEQPEEQAVMNRLGRELDFAIEELRNVARRFLTPLVIRNGLGPALRSITRTWAMSVEVDDRGLSRHDPVAELAVYNLCLEAVQNSIEHGGQNVKARVRLKDSSDGIFFDIRDDGVGFDPATTQPGPGLMGMADRAAVAGGTIKVQASVGQGVAISGRIPDPTGGA